MIKTIYKQLKTGFREKIIGIPSKSGYKFIIKDWTSLKDIHACSRVLETKRFSRNMQPIEMKYPDAKNILVISPHPDDDILGSGGTLKKAIDNGARVHVAYITCGKPEKAEILKRETITVCESIGTIPHFLGCRNGEIPLNDKELNNRLFSLIKDINPGALFITFLLDDHDDHRRVNHLLMKLLENQNSLKTEIWAYQIYSTVIPNVVVNISHHVDVKRASFKVWENVSGNRDWAHYMLGINAANCRYIPSKEPMYVEAFFVVPIKEYLELCRIYFNRNNSDIYYKAYYLTHN